MCHGLIGTVGLKSLKHLIQSSSADHFSLIFLDKLSLLDTVGNVGAWGSWVVWKPRRSKQTNQCRWCLSHVLISRSEMNSPPELSHWRSYIILNRDVWRDKYIHQSGVKWGLHSVASLHETISLLSPYLPDLALCWTQWWKSFTVSFARLITSFNALLPTLKCSRFTIPLPNVASKKGLKG